MWVKAPSHSLAEPKCCRADSATCWHRAHVWWSRASAWSTSTLSGRTEPDAGRIELPCGRTEEKVCQTEPHVGRLGSIFVHSEPKFHRAEPNGPRSSFSVEPSKVCTEAAQHLVGPSPCLADASPDFAEPVGSRPTSARSSPRAAGTSHAWSDQAPSRPKRIQVWRCRSQLRSVRSRSGFARLPP